MFSNLQIHFRIEYCDEETCWDVVNDNNSCVEEDIYFTRIVNDAMCRVKQAMSKFDVEYKESNNANKDC